MSKEKTKTATNLVGANCVRPHFEGKTQKGITLIALIITIIVMLILAGVSVTVSLNGGLFSTAQEAANKTKTVAQQELGLKYNYEIAKATGEFTGSYNEYVLQEQYGLQIGDKVAYNEGSGKTSTIDSAFVMDDLEWRVLGVNEEGQVELISAKPTTSTLTLSNEEGWLNVEEKLDTLCNDLYANGTGVKARSLKIEDIDKLAGITTESDKKVLNSDYGSLWRYKYDATAAKIQYSKSTDNGNTRNLEKLK